jgi:DNA-binding transcriptional LysR family regulator
MHQIDLRRIDLNLLLVFDVLMAQRSVTLAALELGRTQSAVSHALARLREQLGDPLMVKAGGRMVPSPFAEGLVDEVRLILANIRRVLVPPAAFDPATTTRQFLVALPDLNDTIFPLLTQRLRQQAPGATVEWVVRDERAVSRVAEGQIDMAWVPTVQALPDGVAYAATAPLRWATFVRQGHPAIKGWGKAAWSRWPHVAVRIGPALASSPVDAALVSARAGRQVAVWVPHFSAVAPLLAHTDLIATLPLVAMADRLDRYSLRALKTPIHIDPMPHRLIWSARLGNEPALRWLRGHLAAVIEDVLAMTDLVVTR